MLNPHFWKALLVAFLCTFSIEVWSQVKIGDNSQVIEEGSLLELESSDKGFLPPRIALNSKDSWELSGSPVDGMTVYNTVTTSDSLPKGLVTWTDGKWTSASSGGCDLYMMPELTGDTLLLINSCTQDTLVVPIITSDPTMRCYLQEHPLDEPTNASNQTAGKGYVRQRVYNRAQFENLGNSGSNDPSAQPSSVIDAFGVRSMNGEASDSNQPDMDYSEGSSYGEWTEFDGYIYIPMRYPDNSNGKLVTKTEIYDHYTGTSQVDCEYLYIASDAGVYSQEEEDLSLVIDCPASGSQPSFQFDQGQAGRYVRFKAVHSDLGGSSQVAWRIRLTYEDNTSAEIGIRNFIHNISDQGISEYAATEKIKLVHDSENDVWTENGEQVEVNTSLGNLELIDCESLQITFNTNLSGNTFSIQSPFGGSGTGYEYSLDGCLTFQPTASFDLSEYEAVQIIPCVRDGDGVTSSLSGGDSYTSPRSTWHSDMTGASSGDVEYDDPLDRGWEVEYSTSLVHDDFTDANTDSRWQSEVCTTYSHDKEAFYGDFPRAEITDLGGTGTLSTNYDPLWINTVSGAWHHTALTEINIGEQFSWKQEYASVMVGIANSSNPGNYNSSNLDFTFYVQNANNVRIYHSNGSTANTNHAQTGVSNTDVFSIRYTDPTTIDILRNGSVIITETVTEGTKYVALSGNGSRFIYPSSMNTVPSYDLNSIGPGEWNDALGNILDKDDIIRLGATCSSSSFVSAEMDPSLRFTNASRMEIHSLEKFIGGVSVQREIASNTVAGDEYTIAFDFRQYYVGVAGDDLDVRVELLNSSSSIVSQMQFATSGSPDYLITANSDNNLVDRYFKFTADGGAYTLRIRDLSVRNGNQDANGHFYIFDDVRLMKGEYTDNYHYFHSVGSRVRALGITGSGTLTSDPHDISGYDMVYPVFDIRDQGSPDEGEESFSIAYSLDGGEWMTMVSHEGQTDQNNRLQFSDYRFDKGIPTGGATQIRYQVTINGIGQNGDGYEIFEIRDEMLKH